MHAVTDESARRPGSFRALASFLVDCEGRSHLDLDRPDRDHDRRFGLSPAVSVRSSFVGLGSSPTESRGASEEISRTASFFNFRP